MGRNKGNAKMAKTYIVKVKPDYSIEKVEFDETDSIAQLQEAVGGYIEHVPVGMRHYLDLFVNEEGSLIPLETNAILSLVYSVGVERAALIRGDGVFAAHDGEGNTVGIEEDRADAIVSLLEDIREAFIKCAVAREVGYDA
jgi:hypothetical protein